MSQVTLKELWKVEFINLDVHLLKNLWNADEVLVFFGNMGDVFRVLANSYIRHVVSTYLFTWNFSSKGISVLGAKHHLTETIRNYG